MVQWFSGLDEGASPNWIEDERESMNCKNKTKTRLRTNYSYYRILIVEDA